MTYTLLLMWVVGGNPAMISISGYRSRLLCDADGFYWSTKPIMEKRQGLGWQHREHLCFAVGGKK